MKVIILCLLAAMTACSHPPQPAPTWRSEYPANFFAATKRSSKSEVRSDVRSSTVKFSVHGSVQNPGLVVLPAGSNLVDAIVAAGGAYGGGIIGGAYRFTVRRLDATYTLNAAHGAAALRRFVMQNGDEVFAAQ